MVATSLLQIGFELKRKECFKCLLEAGANPYSVRWGVQPLIHRAAQEDDTFWLEEILDHGGDPNQHNTLNHVYPLQMAIEANQPENARLLLERGSRSDMLNFRSETPLVRSWNSGRYEIAFLLLERGVDFNTSSIPSKSLIALLQFEDKYRDEKPPATPREARELEFREKCYEWFREKKIDWRHATCDLSAKSKKQTWVIPEWRDDDTEKRE